MPLPKTLIPLPAAAGTFAFIAEAFARVGSGGVFKALLPLLGDKGSEFCLTRRCLSSGSSSESESSASKASARAGSLTCLFRGTVEEARE